MSTNKRNNFLYVDKHIIHFLLISGTCSFDQHTFCSWRNERYNDNFDWLIRYGTTPSKNTGPTSDHSGNISDCCTVIPNLVRFRPSGPFFESPGKFSSREAELFLSTSFAFKQKLRLMQRFKSKNLFFSATNLKSWLFEPENIPALRETGPCQHPLRSITRRSLFGIIMGYLDDYMAGRLYGGPP